jgi:hypothetical protein
VAVAALILALLAAPEPDAVDFGSTASRRVRLLARVGRLRPKLYRAPWQP